MLVAPLSRIRQALADIDPPDLMTALEAGFVAYTEGRAVVPPVGELAFDRPPGEVHIKYGYIRGGEHYVIKVASGFYENPQVGLPSSNGLMLLFRQRTGELAAVLLDEGLLTDVRTAVAGAIAARHLAPRVVRRIGIVGCGIQARLQLQHLRAVTSCRDVLVWGRRAEAVASYCAEMRPLGFVVSAAQDAAELASACNLIVTTTPSRAPLLMSGMIRPGTHITAVGSDTPDKQELDPGIARKADRVVADSLSQCRVRGEIAHALRAGLPESQVVELGAVIAGRAPGRTGDEQITVADLTGVAVQDIQIASAVLQRLPATAATAT